MPLWQVYFEDDPDPDPGPDLITLKATTIAITHNMENIVDATTNFSGVARRNLVSNKYPVTRIITITIKIITDVLFIYLIVFKNSI